MQRQVRRALMAAGGQPISATQIYDWTYAKRRLLGPPINQAHRWSVRRVLLAMGAKPIGRVGPRHAIVWKLPDELAARWR